MDNITMPSADQPAINENGIVNRVWFLFFEKIYRSLTSFLSLTGSAYFGEANIDASAKVQIDSTTQGFAPPRMTTAEKLAIPSPMESLLVYDTDLKRLCVYDGTGWDTY